MSTTTLLVCIGIAFVFCWQIGLTGGIMQIMLTALQVYLAFVIQRKNERRVNEDEAGKVS
jgi:hypothetical protein